MTLVDFGKRCPDCGDQMFVGQMHVCGTLGPPDSEAFDSDPEPIGLEPFELKESSHCGCQSKMAQAYAKAYVEGYPEFSDENWNDIFFWVPVEDDPVLIETTKGSLAIAHWVVDPHPSNDGRWVSDAEFPNGFCVARWRFPPK